MPSARPERIDADFTNSGAKNGDKSSTLGYFFAMAARHVMHGVSLGLHRWQ
ncbi:hypothetical protein [Streptomyces sp. NPDC056468]|uniref:hypothetical protein n=1 Tax=unclassified Streptomyces TaxID=2593676 RepID=UPI00369B0F5D